MRLVRIEIDASAANDPDAHHWLDRILHKVDDGWHVWDTTNQPEPSEIENTSWIRDRGNQGKWVLDLHVASIRRSAWSSAPHGRRVHVTMFPNAADEFTPENAVRLAEEPMVILVENRNSDGAFVRRIVAELDRALHRVWQLTGDPIRIDSLGGAGEMPAEVARRTQDALYRPRLVVIADSDRRGPDDDESDAARRLRRTSETHGVACWVLAKREADNYLPRILLAERPDAGMDHTRLVEVWERLSDDQKDFFDMKNGLPEVPSEVEEVLFGELSPVDRMTLSSGFGPNVHSCWGLWNVKAKSELVRRGRGELERGIEQIRREV